MASGFLTWASVLVANLVVSGIALRFLAVQGIPTSQSLVARGLVCVMAVVVFARYRRQSLVPKRIRTQVFRALLAGLALTLFTMSYTWLTASAVSVLSNIDVPLLIAFGPLVGVRTSWKAQSLAVAAIAILVFYVAALETDANLLYGLSTLMSGTVLLCFGYLFIKKTMSEENEAVTIVVPALAIIVYGTLQAGLEAPSASVWTTQAALANLLSGASMFGAYHATMRLYERTDLANAEFPTLVSGLVIQPVEVALLDVRWETTYAVSALLFVLVIFVLLRIQNRASALAST